jgi:hypothetical protein
LQLHAAPGRAIGLGKHQRQIETRLMQSSESDGSKFRRAGENNFH